MKKLTVLGFMLLSSVATLATSYAFDIPEGMFEDVDYSSYYTEGLANMVKKGVITGYDDGTFRPNNTLSRAEFVTALDRYNIDVSNMKVVVCNGGISRDELDDLYKITYDALCND